MPQASITINSVPGSNDDLTINTLVQLDNQNIGGESTYLWSILDQPPGATDSLSNPAIKNPTFTPKKEGSYLLQLIVNYSLPDEQRDRVIAAVRQVKTRQRIPAAGETVETDSADGWASATNSLFRQIDGQLADGWTVVGVNSSGGTLTKGDVVRVTSGAIIKSGLPGQEIVPGFVKAPATTLGNLDELLCVTEGDISGGTSIGAGALMRARVLGKILALSIGAGAVGATVYVTDTATIDTVPGTIRRRCGSIMAIGTSSRDVWFDGVGGQDITPIDAPYVVYGAPGVLTNPNRIDGASATGASGGKAYTFKAVDATTVPLVAQRYGTGAYDAFQAQTEAGVPMVYVTAEGELKLWPGGDIMRTVNTDALFLSGSSTISGAVGTARLGLYGSSSGGAPSWAVVWANRLLVNDTSGGQKFLVDCATSKTVIGGGAARGGAGDLTISGGHVYLDNAKNIYARNNAGSADIPLMKLSGAANNVILGDSAVGTIALNSSTGVDFQDSGSVFAALDENSGSVSLTLYPQLSSTDAGIYLKNFGGTKSWNLLLDGAFSTSDDVLKLGWTGVSSGEALAVYNNDEGTYPFVWQLKNKLVIGSAAFGTTYLSYSAGAQALFIHSDSSAPDPTIPVVKIQRGVSAAASGGLDIIVSTTTVELNSHAHNLHIGTVEPDSMILKTTDIERFRITDDGRLSTGGVTAPDAVIGGITLKADPSVNFAKYVSLKDTGMTHGITSSTVYGTFETDTFSMVGEHESSGATQGGLDLVGLTEGAIAVWIAGGVTSADSTTAETSDGVVNISSLKKSGSTLVSLGDTENLMTVKSGLSCRFIFKRNGDLAHWNGLGFTNYDDEQDAIACRDLAYVLANDPKKVLQYHQKELERLGVLENGFMSTQAFNGLVLGAVGELYHIVDYLCQKFGLTYEDIRQEIRAAAR